MKKLVYVLGSLVMIVSFQNCGKNSAPVNLGGTMTQQVQLGVDPNVGAQIQKIFSDLFSRAPTAAELAQYQQMLSTGAATIAQIRDALAHSAEAQALIKTLLEQYFGSSSTASINAWLSALSGNTSLAEIIALFSGV